MSKAIHICCDYCGKDLSQSLSISGDKNTQEVHYFQVLDEFGHEEEICPNCYGVIKVELYSRR